MKQSPPTGSTVPPAARGKPRPSCFRSSGTQFDPSIVEAFITSGILSAAAAASSAEAAPADGNGEGPREDGEALFSTVATHLLEGCRQFAGEHVTSAIVGQVAAQAHRRNWTMEVADGRVVLQAAGRHSLEEARQQVIAWLLQGIEQRSGRRIAFHLLSETLAQMPPAARGLYGSVLLSPPWEEAAPRAGAARHAS